MDRRHWERVTSAKKTLNEHPGLLANEPHPKLPPGSNLTARNYAAWLLDNAGRAGRTKACVMVERAMVGVPAPPDEIPYGEHVIPFRR
jgi:hypothetical protein